MKRRWIAGLLLSLLGTAGLMTTLTGPARASGWDSRVKLSDESTDWWYPAIAVEQVFGENVHVLWRENAGSRVQYRHSAYSGTAWYPIQTLDSNASAMRPRIATAGNTVHAVWEGPSGEIRYRRSYDNGANWQALVILSTAGQSTGDSPDVACLQDNVYVAWAKSYSLGRDILCRRSTDNGATWSAVYNVTSDGATTLEINPRLAASYFAYVYAVWTNDLSPSPVTSSFKRSTDRGATWSSAVTLWSPGAVHSVAAYGSMVFTDRDGPTQRFSTDWGVTWSGNFTLGAGSSYEVNCDASRSYADHACNAYIDIRSSVWKLFYSCGVNGETYLGPASQSQPPDIGSDQHGNMHVVHSQGSEIWYYRYISPESYAYWWRPPQVTDGFDESDAAWGDFDGDGDQDLVICGKTGATDILQTLTYEDTGDTLVIKANSLPGVSNQSSGNLAWGDYDNDGDLDLALAGMSASGRIARVYRNDGHGVLTWDSAQPLVGVSDASVAWGDYDHDGTLDLLVMGYDGTSCSTRLYRNHPLGTLTEDTANPIVGLANGSADWGDLDGDGDLDLLLTGTDGTAVRTVFYENNPIGILAGGGSHGLPAVALSDVALGDFNGDRRLDIAITGVGTGNSHYASVYRNDGGWTFTLWASGLLDAYRSSCAWGDFDNDGDLDLALAGTTGSAYNTVLLRNTGSGFTFASANLVGVDDGSLTWDDVNGDGRLDLLVTGGYASGVNVTELYKGDGGLPDAVPSPPVTLTSAQNVYGLTLNWSGAGDQESPAGALYYCLKVGTTAGGNDVFSGTYGTPLMGNSGQALSRYLNLPPRTYYWAVRSIDTGLRPSAWSAIQTSPPHAVDYADHDVGSCILTMTDRGILGFMDASQAQGSGFVYPSTGSNLLYIGSLWVGENASYVANRDYDADPAREWTVSGNPDGHVWIDRIRGDSDQDILTAYNDTAAAVPRRLLVRQESWAYAAPAPAKGLVIVTYRIRNRQTSTLNDIYAGVFLDLDIHDAARNTAGTDLSRRLAWVQDSTGACGGVLLLQDQGGSPPLKNDTVISNPTFIWPQSYMLDPDKYAFLSWADGAHHLAAAATPDDYSVLVSSGPFTLPAGGEVAVSFAVVGGTSLADLVQNADVASLIFRSGVSDVGPEGTAPPFEAGAVRLLSSAPNPFRDDTWIRFTLTGRAWVDLGIFDVGGRRVRRLYQGWCSAPVSALRWDGRNAAGRALPAGVYFLRLEAGRQGETQRIVRIR